MKKKVGMMEHGYKAHRKASRNVMYALTLETIPMIYSGLLLFLEV